MYRRKKSSDFQIRDKTLQNATNLRYTKVIEDAQIRKKSKKIKSSFSSFLKDLV